MFSIENELYRFHLIKKLRLKFSIPGLCLHGIHKLAVRNNAVQK